VDNILITSVKYSGSSYNKLVGQLEYSGINIMDTYRIKLSIILWY